MTNRMGQDIRFKAADTTTLLLPPTAKVKKDLPHPYHLKAQVKRIATTSEEVPKNGGENNEF
jgi:hypothetical protein